MARTTSCIISGRTETQDEQVDFGLKDAHGRAIGARISRFEFTATPTDEFLYGVYLLPEGMEGRVFAFYPQAMRNDVKYGASQQSRYFRTEAEREAAITEYLRNATKRAAAKAS